MVLKSCEKGLFNPGNRSLEKLIKTQAEKFNIKVYDLALNWSHIHILLRLKNQNDYIKFIRSLTAILVIRIRKFKPNIRKVFDLRPFTRIISWGGDFKHALNYQILNQMESLNLIVRPKKRLRLKKASSKPGS